MSDNAPTPADYDAEDGWDDFNGVEQCPHCGTHLGGQGGTHGPVWTQSGRHYEHYYDTDPGEAPFFCESCWAELDANRRAAENESLLSFAGGDGQ